MFGRDDEKDEDNKQPGVQTIVPDTVTRDPSIVDTTAPTAGSPPVDTTSPVVDEPAPVEASAPDNSEDAPLPVTVSDAHELIDIKQQALQQLSPLVDHLDQTPEEKFNTLMMMIQAADDQTLVKAAYDAATAITEEKVKAQALLDVVNEINYFTQQKAE